MYQWVPASGDRRPGVPYAKGTGFISFPATPNFERVLAAQAAPAGGDPGLRPYRIGKYPDLIGMNVSDLQVRDDPDGPTQISLQDPQAFADIKPTARKVRWSYLIGYVDKVGPHRPLAFAANGVIAGLMTATPVGPSSDVGLFFGSLALPLFHAGANQLQAFAISGPPDHPVLDPVTIAGLPKSAGGTAPG
jgi:hypothetical protein